MTCDVTRFRKESDRRQSSQSTIRTRSVTLPLLLTGKKAFLTTRTPSCHRISHPSSSGGWNTCLDLERVGEVDGTRRRPHK